MACLALTLTLLGLTRLGTAGERLGGGLLLIIGLALLSLYVRQSLRKSDPLLNLHLIRRPLFRTSMLIYQLVPGIFTGVSLLAMLYLQNQLSVSATRVGELMLPWALAAFVAISLTGKQFNRLGPKPLFITGCLINGLGMAALTLIDSNDPRITQIVCFALMGFGSSLCSSTAQSAAFIEIPDAELADASALWNINRQLSFCLGVTLMSLLFSLLLVLTHGSALLAYRNSFIAAGLSCVIPIALCLRLPSKTFASKLIQ